MTKKKFKPFVQPLLFLLIVVVFAISVSFIKNILKEALDKPNQDNVSYVDSEIISILDSVPVISTKPQIIKPFLVDNVEILKDFYDYQGDNETQEKSLIYYENTYMQNSGIDYKSSEKFDVIAIYDGTVTNIKTDDILGTIIEIKHNDNLISVYQSITEPIVKINDKVEQGQILAKSGQNNIFKDIKEHLHFELYYEGQIVDPENFFGKKIEEL